MRREAGYYLPPDDNRPDQEREQLDERDEWFIEPQERFFLGDVEINADPCEVQA